VVSSRVPSAFRRSCSNRLLQPTAARLRSMPCLLRCPYITAASACRALCRSAYLLPGVGVWGGGPVLWEHGQRLRNSFLTCISGDVNQEGRCCRCVGGALDVLYLKLPPFFYRAICIFDDIYLVPVPVSFPSLDDGEGAGGRKLGVDAAELLVSGAADLAWRCTTRALPLETVARSTVTG